MEKKEVSHSTTSLSRGENMLREVTRCSSSIRRQEAGIVFEMDGVLTL